MAATSFLTSSQTSTVESDRLIRSHTSSAGRFTSRGTTTLPLSTVPK